MCWLHFMFYIIMWIYIIRNFTLNGIYVLQMF